MQLPTVSGARPKNGGIMMKMLSVCILGVALLATPSFAQTSDAAKTGKPAAEAAKSRKDAPKAENKLGKSGEHRQDAEHRADKVKKEKKAKQ